MSETILSIGGRDKDYVVEKFQNEKKFSPYTDPFLISDNVFLYVVHYIEEIKKYALCKHVINNFCPFCQIGYDKRLRAILQIQYKNDSEFDEIEVPASILHTLPSFENINDKFYWILTKNGFGGTGNFYTCGVVKENLPTFPVWNPNPYKYISSQEIEIPKFCVSINAKYTAYSEIPPAILSVLGFPIKTDYNFNKLYPTQKSINQWLILTKDLLNFDWNQIISEKIFNLNNNDLQDLSAPIQENRSKGKIIALNNISNILTKKKIERKLTHISYFTNNGSNMYTLHNNFPCFIQGLNDNTSITCTISTQKCHT